MNIELLQIQDVIQPLYKLPLIPLINKNLIDLKNHITIDSKSGYSGAGKNLEKKFTHKNLYKSIFAYTVPKPIDIFAEIDRTNC